MSEDKAKYHSKIWLEEAQEDNPFVAQASFCHGYNVYEDILSKASWSDYLYLLFKGERPCKNSSLLLEKVAIAIANPGMRDESVRAAMNAGVGGSTAAASLIAALGVGAGQFGGAREVYVLVEQWGNCQLSLEKWCSFLEAPNMDIEQVDIWPKFDHVPGFNPYAKKKSLQVQQCLNEFTRHSPRGYLTWLIENQSKLEDAAGNALSMTIVVACALFDLGLNAKQAEMLFMMLRLPGAAVHALEQEQLGWKKFPFFGKETILTDDPGNVS